MKKQSLALFLASFFAGIPVYANALETASSATPAQTASQQLPREPNLISGTLDNGLRYYIFKNAEPKEHVYLRLVVNAGSLNEDNDQLGIAHLVEHLAFNGSEDFPDNTVISALEKAGLKFGRDVNASTDYENTIYKLNVPKNDPSSLSIAFRVLANWANKVTIFKDNLDAERGIILEEWRAGLSPMQRYSEKREKLELANSRYLTRKPIGDMDMIKNISKYRVADFYQKWYRPDNMAVVIVGDVEPEEIKKQLAILNAIQKPQTALEAIDYRIPTPKGWRTQAVQEKDVDMAMVDFAFLTTVKTDHSLARYRDEIAEQIVRRLVNLRLQKWEKNHPLAFDGANFYISGLGRETQKNVFLVRLTKKNYTQATQALMNFLAQIKQYGFSEQEVQDEVARLQALVKQNDNNQPPKSSTLAEMLVLTAGADQPFLTPRTRTQLNNDLLGKITVADVNRAFNQIIQSESRIATNTYKKAPQPKTSSVQQLEKQWERAMTTAQPKWNVAKKAKAEIPDLALTKGSVKLVKTWEDIGVKEFALSNGSKLVYRYSKNTPNRVYFRASTTGGLRSIPTKDYHLLRVATSLVDRTGIGVLSSEQLQQIYQKTPLRFATMLDDYQQGFSGWANTENFPVMLQLMHLKLAKSPISKEVLQDFQRTGTPKLNNKFSEKVANLRYPHLPNLFSLKPAISKKWTTQQLSNAVQHYINSKTDFTYFIVGDISQEQLITLAENYLASVKVKKSPREAKATPAQLLTKRFSAKESNEPRAEVNLYFEQNHEIDLAEAYYLEMASELLQDKLRDALREQSSGVYNVTSWINYNYRTKQIDGRIQFASDPTRADELITQAKQVIQQMQTEGINEADLNDKIAQHKKALNQYWKNDLAIIDALDRSYTRVGSPALLTHRKQVLETMTKAKIEHAFNQFIQNAALFEAVLLPKK